MENKFKSPEAERFIKEVDRIILEKKAKNASQIAKSVGYISQDFTDIKAGKKNLQREFLELVAEKYPIDKRFILTGEVGLDSQTGPNATYIAPISYPIEHGEQKSIPLGEGKYLIIAPLVNEYAYAGYLVGWKDPEYIEELPKHTVVVDKQPHSEYKAFEVVGDSMRNPEDLEDSILDGSIATGRFLDRHHWTSKFHTHRWKDFIIVHKDGILIKRIKKHEVLSGLVTLESLNPDKVTYPDRVIHLDDVFQIFNIINVSRAR